MSKNLLIIESPNKIETISNYLDKSFKIIATIGHVRDLSNKEVFGFNSKTLEPYWSIPRKNKFIKNSRSKKDIIDEIRTEAAKAETIYIATDPDREGEAIA
jgi:DNA topoisomerase-1